MLPTGEPTTESQRQALAARARCRGTALFHIQVPIDFAAVNCKRLVRHAGVAAGGIAAAPVLVAMSTGPGLHGPPEGLPRPQKQSTGGSAGSTSAIWSFSVCLN